MWADLHLSSPGPTPRHLHMLFWLDSFTTFCEEISLPWWRASQYKRMFGETRRKLTLSGFLSMKRMFLYCCPCYQEASVCLSVSFSNCGKNSQEKSQKVESAHLICFGTYWLVPCQAFWFLYFLFKASKVGCWQWLTWLIVCCLPRPQGSLCLQPPVLYSLSAAFNMNH